MIRPDQCRSSSRRRRLLFTLLVAMLLASACASSAGSDETAQATTTTVPKAPAKAESATQPATTIETSAPVEESDDTVSPTGPARAQLDWVVTVLNDGGQLTIDEIEERFGPAFLAEIPADQLAAFIPQVLEFAEPPFTVERFEPSDGGLSAEAVLVGADDRRLSTQIHVAASAPNLIQGLGFVPTELEFPVPVDVQTIDDRLVDMAPRSSLGVYDVTGGSCTAVHEIRSDSTIVLGSVFKLWVLAALAHEIDEGRASWDETVPVADELRSSLDGEIYELETDTEVSLQRLAEAMISISDNTATDMLLDRLGRETVEATLQRIGVDDLDANIPMLSTGNLFTLKFAPDKPNAVDYRALDEAGKRSMLSELDQAISPWVSSGMSPSEIAASTNADGVPIDEPRDLDIEWFATAEDLCQTLVHLDEMARIPGLESVASILEINPGGGIPFDRDRWPTIRFKGGSEPGVAAGAWWFEGSDDSRYVVAGGVANPDTAIDSIDAVLILASAIELIE